MDLLDQITDPSDFPIDSLRKLDSSLRCTICKEFFDAPVVLHCGHTFCSLCIRSVLPTKPECPTCRATTKELHLVRNAMFEEAVSAWSDARALILKSAKRSVQPSAAPPINSRGKKRKLSHSSEPSGPEAGPSRLPRRGSNDSHGSQHEETSGETLKERRQRDRRHESQDEVVPSSDPDEKELPNIAKTNPYVACPVCSCQVPYNSINVHMDSDCKAFGSDGSSSTPRAGTKRDSKAAWGSILDGQGKKASVASSAKDSDIPTTKIAKVSYGLLNLDGLRKLLSEKGLPTSGDKDELITRHMRWIAIFNANLDRGQPKSIGELKRHLKELEEVANRPGTKKVHDDKAWTRKNKAQFASLIETARPKVKEEKEKSASPLSSRPHLSASSSSSVPNAGTSSDAIVIE